MAKVYISPSKQEANVGTGNYGTEEQRMNAVADVVCKCLDASGITWERNDPEMSSAEIVADSNRAKVALHVALHSNASNTKARGGEVLVCSMQSKAVPFAEKLYKHVSALTPTEDRGIKANPSIMELRKTTAPAALVEYAFHDNDADAQFILGHTVELGVATAHAICDYFKVVLVNPYAKPIAEYYVYINDKPYGPYKGTIPDVRVIKK